MESQIECPYGSACLLRKDAKHEKSFVHTKNIVIPYCDSSNCPYYIKLFAHIHKLTTTQLTSNELAECAAHCSVKYHVPDRIEPVRRRSLDVYHSQNSQTNLVAPRALKPGAHGKRISIEGPISPISPGSPISPRQSFIRHIVDSKSLEDIKRDNIEIHKELSEIKDMLKILLAKI
jgi:hypothetical protein